MSASLRRDTRFSSSRRRLRNRAESSLDLDDRLVKVVRESTVQQGAHHWIGEESPADDRARRAESEIRVLEIARQLLEVADDLGEIRLGRPTSERCRIRVPPVHPGIARRVRSHRRDDVCVTVVREPVDEIPAAPERANAEQPQRHAAEEQGCDEWFVCSSCRQRCAQRESAEAELLPLVATELCKATLGFDDRACVHESTIGCTRETDIRPLPQEGWGFTAKSRGVSAAAERWEDGAPLASVPCSVRDDELRRPSEGGGRDCSRLPEEGLARPASRRHLPVLYAA
jgi:hypothetical protein